MACHCQWGLGESGWTYYESLFGAKQVQNAPTDLFFFFSFTPMLLALLLRKEPHGSGRDWARLLDAVLVPDEGRNESIAKLAPRGTSRAPRAAPSQAARRGAALTPALRLEFSGRRQRAGHTRLRNSCSTRFATIAAKINAVATRA